MPLRQPALRVICGGGMFVIAVNQTSSGVDARGVLERRRQCRGRRTYVCVSTSCGGILFSRIVRLYPSRSCARVFVSNLADHRSDVALRGGRRHIGERARCLTQSG